MSNLVFVLDTEKQPLLPVHPGKARRLLNAPKAAVFRRDPFTIILKKVVVTAAPESITLKIDPGSWRRSRINRHTPYRQARFLNRTRPKGRLAPSLQHRAENTLTWVKKLL